MRDLAIKGIYEYPEDYKKDINLKLRNGYLCFYDKEHPLAHKNESIVLHHRHIASVKLGRWLNNKEIVHHIDKNKTNNSPDNLEITNSSDHSRLHAKDRIGIKVNRNKSKEFYKCDNCGRDYTRIRGRKRFCSNACFGQFSTFKLTISKEELEKLVWSLDLKSVGKLYKTSGVTISKICDDLQIRKPESGFWMKKENKILLKNNLTNFNIK